MPKVRISHHHLDRRMANVLGHCGDWHSAHDAAAAGSLPTSGDWVKRCKEEWIER
jgi:hypothetical protein